MRISIFGLGYVGCVSLGCLAKTGHYVVGVDINESKVEQINSGMATIIESGIQKLIADQFKAGNIEATMDPLDAVQKSELSIIAVATPSSDKGHLNNQYIFSVAENIGSGLNI